MKTFTSSYPAKACLPIDEGKQTEVGAGDITIARPGQSHALKNIGKKPLVFLDLIAETAGAKAAETK